MDKLLRYHPLVLHLVEKKTNITTTTKNTTGQTINYPLSGTYINLDMFHGSENRIY
jgi:hypothetical protein